MAYPAEKLIALKSTTTPALTTHVIMVGLTISSKVPDLRGFFITRRSFEVEAFRLPLSWVDVAGRLLFEEDPESRRAVTRVPWVFSSPMTMDSGTIRSVLGSGLFDVPAPFVAVSRFGRPLAAAAQESNVERLALNAASWSA